MLPKFAFIVTLAIIVNISDAFKIVSYSSHEADHYPGDHVTLVCRSDDYWEYCTWKHKKRTCNLEWKYATGNVTKQKCHDDIDDRVTIAGDYEKHECSIKISDLELNDAGSWQCEMEEYRSGLFRGYTAQKNIDLNVVKATTPTSTTQSTTLIDTTTVSTDSTTSSSTTTTVVESTTTDISNIDEDYSPVPDESHNDTKDEEVEALPVSDKEALVPETSSSVGVIAGVIVTMVVLIIVLTMAVITWHRRRKSHLAIISYLQTERDDAMAANSFLEEAEYHISIIRDPQSLPLQQQQTLKTATDVLDNENADTVVSDSKET